MRRFHFLLAPLVVGLVAPNLALDTGFVAKAAAEPTVFRDCPECPEMVEVPAGSFTMGSPPNEKDRKRTEGPQHTVAIAKAFAMSRFEVTFGEWDACVADGGCNGHSPQDAGWGRADRPVIHVNWEDIQTYVSWLSMKTGQEYRLPSEAEWEYAARAGTATRYWWGEDIGSNNANCDGCGSQWDNSSTAPVGSFKANKFGLYDTAGNVREFVEDCWSRNYEGAPTDGSVRPMEQCQSQIHRGGSWRDIPGDLRAAGRKDINVRTDFMGFRVAKSIED